MKQSNPYPAFSDAARAWQEGYDACRAALANDGEVEEAQLWEDQVVEFVRNGQNIDAVRLMREKASVGLTVAKRVVCDNWDMMGGRFAELAARCEEARKR